MNVRRVLDIVPALVSHGHQHYETSFIGTVASCAGCRRDRTVILAEGSRGTLDPTAGPAWIAG